MYTPPHKQSRLPPFGSRYISLQWTIQKLGYLIRFGLWQIKYRLRKVVSLPMSSPHADLNKRARINLSGVT